MIASCMNILNLCKDLWENTTKVIFCYGNRIGVPSALEKSCPTSRKKLSKHHVAALRALGRCIVSFWKLISKLLSSFCKEICFWNFWNKKKMCLISNFFFQIPSAKFSYHSTYWNGGFDIKLDYSACSVNVNILILCKDFWEKTTRVFVMERELKLLPLQKNPVQHSGIKCPYFM